MMKLSDYMGQKLTPEEIELKKYFSLKAEEVISAGARQKEQKAAKAQQLRDIRNTLSNVTSAPAHRPLPSIVPILVEDQGIVSSSIEEPEVEDYIQKITNSPASMNSKRRRHTDNDDDDSTDQENKVIGKLSEVISSEAVKTKGNVPNKLSGKITRQETGDSIQSREQSRQASESHLDQEFFHPDYILMSGQWNPYDEFDKNGHDAEPLELVLDDYGLDKKQTLAIKLTVPSNSDHYSINIIPFENPNDDDIFYHINPRKAKVQYKKLFSM